MEEPNGQLQQGVKKAGKPRKRRVQLSRYKTLPDDVWEAMSVDERKAHAKSKREAAAAEAKVAKEAAGGGKAEKKPEIGKLDDEIWAAMSEEERKVHIKAKRAARSKKLKIPATKRAVPEKKEGKRGKTVPDDVWAAMSVDQRKAHAKAKREAAAAESKSRKQPSVNAKMNIPPDQVEAFLSALHREYVENVRDAVGDALDNHPSKLPRSAERLVDQLEKRVRRAKGKEAKAAEIQTIRAELLGGAVPAHMGKGCSSDSDNRSDTSSSSSDSRGGGGDLRGMTMDEINALRDSHVGGCVLRNPARDAHPDPHALRVLPSAVVETEEWERFPRIISVCGLNYLGADGVTDEFLSAVASLTCQLFAQAEHIDDAQQIAVMQNCYRYQATCPISVGGDHKGVEPTDHTEACYSVCDRIGEGVRSQAMEVLEHVLHHVTDVGFHYAFPNDWGLNTESRLHAAMQEAVQASVYDLSDYEEECLDPDDPHLLRIELQEFGYWIITTGWDLQAEFGPFKPTGEPQAEWKVRTAVEMKEKLPRSQSLFDETVATTLIPPTVESMRALSAFERPEEFSVGSDSDE